MMTCVPANRCLHLHGPLTLVRLCPWHRMMTVARLAAARLVAMME